MGVYEHTVIVSLVWMHSSRRIKDVCVCGPEASTSSLPVASWQASLYRITSTLSFPMGKRSQRQAFAILTRSQRPYNFDYESSLSNQPCKQAWAKKLSMVLTTASSVYSSSCMCLTLPIPIVDTILRGHRSDRARHHRLAVRSSTARANVGPCDNFRPGPDFRHPVSIVLP